jgi:flagellar biosynthesis protein FlhG
MQDQADRLRALVRTAAQTTSDLALPAPQKLVVGGGKGGVGVTTIAVGLSMALARLGSRVVLVDADIQRPDIATLCQLEPRATIADVLSSRRTVHEVLERGPAGIQLLMGEWSTSSVPDCSPVAQERLLHELDRLGRHADLVVLDVGNGLNNVVRRFWQAADRALLVTTPDTLSIMDAYAAIKMLAVDRRELKIEIVVNRSDSTTAAEVHHRIERACERFLDRHVALAGHIPDENHGHPSSDGIGPLSFYEGQRPAAREINALAERLMVAAQQHAKAESTHGTLSPTVAA